MRPDLGKCPAPARRVFDETDDLCPKWMTCANAEYAGKRQQAGKVPFLIEKDQVAPWKGDQRLQRCQRHYPVHVAQKHLTARALLLGVETQRGEGRLFHGDNPVSEQ
jgi:hypothetical protein